jgi:riboflavin kinase/FMN adenylyltransferase
VPDARYVTPGHGVYACRAGFVGPDAEAWFTAAVNVGVRPQFVTGRGELVEAYLLDFDGDAYGQQLRIAFCERLRGERRFESVDVLVEQMGRDVDRARELIGG